MTRPVDARWAISARDTVSHWTTGQLLELRSNLQRHVRDVAEKVSSDEDVLGM